VTQIGFWALEDLQKEGREPRLPVLPLAVKYRCVRDARGTIDASLRSLEGALCLSREPGATFYQRLRRVGERVLGTVEAEFGLKPAADVPLAERVLATKQHVIERVAREAGVERPVALPLPDQMRAMFNAVTVYAEEFADTPGDYGCRQHARRLDAAHLLLRDLWRLQNFLTVTDGYVAERLTAERFLDVLGRLEVEVFGAVRHSEPREAVVRLAPAIDLGRHYEEYQRRKRETVAAVTSCVEERVRALLSELAAVGTPVEA
jgi:hypothetical protein